MKLYIIAGEASGDLHGSNLIKALKAQQPNVECRVWGGDLMEAAGGKLVKHYRDLAFMGFVEVLLNLRTILTNIRLCKEDITRFQPDAVVLVDYPGFNLRIAKWLREQVISGAISTRIIYYISPQIWAWHTSRVHDIKRDMDAVLVILPFESEFYAKYGVKTAYVGHPLLDVIPEMANFDDRKNIIALLPGSRRQEIGKILPRMLSVVPDFPEYEFVIAASTALPLEIYRQYTDAYPGVKIVQGDTYEVLKSAKAALVKSGTSTLETALIGTPQVVCYAGSAISYAIARRVVDIKYISLVNLIADGPVVKELIQSELNRANIRTELHRILQPEQAEALRKSYAVIRKDLGSSGSSARAAEIILSK